jgi:hypothetical protein
MASCEEKIVAITIQLARIEEHLINTDRAIVVAKEELDRWEHSANEWRKAINDERVAFVTRTELAAAISVVISLVLLALKFIH